jgi:hypothetical protein
MRLVNHILLAKYICHMLVMYAHIGVQSSREGLGECCGSAISEDSDCLLYVVALPLRMRSVSGEEEHWTELRGTPP